MTSIFTKIAHLLTRKINFALGLSSFMLAIAAGFLTAPAHAADFRITLEINETHRTAIIYEPRRLKRVPRATLIVLHGTENGARIRRRLGLDALVANAGYATVYPDALNGQWNNGLEGAPGRPDDNAYLRALIAKLVSAGLSDPRRIYIIGSSDGGLMALRFACESSNLIAGTVTLLASLPVSLAESCKLTKPIPYLSIAGTVDPLVPFTGGPVAIKGRKGDVISVDKTVELFASAGGCIGPRSVRQLQDKDKDDNSTANLETYAGCKVPVNLIRIEGGGHAFPGRRTAIMGPSGSVGPVNRDIESNKVIWDFVRSLPR